STACSPLSSSGASLFFLTKSVSWPVHFTSWHSAVPSEKTRKYTEGIFRPIVLCLLMTSRTKLTDGSGLGPDASKQSVPDKSKANKAGRVVVLFLRGPHAIRCRS